MRTFIGVLCLLIPQWSVLAAPTVQSSKIEENLYYLKLENDRDMSISEAQSALSGAAKTLCGSLVPEFGPYKFESSIAVDKADASANAGTAQSKTDSFLFYQQLRCNSANKQANKKPTPAIDDQKRSEIAKKVGSATKDYFKSLSANEFKSAHAYFSASMKASLPFEQWKDKQAKQNNDAGALVGGGVKSVAVYVDPKSAPRPGIYVAADFQYQYEEAPYRCGYLMWYSVDGEAFEISRLEDGVITSESVSDLSTDELKAVKETFLCDAN